MRRAQDVLGVVLPLRERLAVELKAQPHHPQRQLIARGDGVLLSQCQRRGAPSERGVMGWRDHLKAPPAVREQQLEVGGA